jgi:hypothetical protein
MRFRLCLLSQPLFIYRCRHDRHQLLCAYKYVNHICIHRCPKWCLLILDQRCLEPLHLCRHCATRHQPKQNLESSTTPCATWSQTVSSRCLRMGSPQQSSTSLASERSTDINHRAQHRYQPPSTHRHGCKAASLWPARYTPERAYV